MLLVVCLSPPTLYEKIKTYKSSLHSLLTSIHQSTNPTTPALKLGKRCLSLAPDKEYFGMSEEFGLTKW